MSLSAPDDYRSSLLYEDCVSAHLFIEVDDVLDDEAYAFMCAVWRFPKFTVYCQDAVVYRCSANEECYVYDCLAAEQVCWKSLRCCVSIGDETQEILSFPSPMYQFMSGGVHVNKHASTCYRFGVYTKSSSTVQSDRVAVRSHCDIRTRFLFEAAENALSQNISERLRRGL